ncbi:MAG: pyridoxal phosphate-dependent decarboxylase family protein [Candidatus Limnocylindria bacterium]
MADDRERALRRASELGLEFLAGLGERHVGALTDDLGLVAKLSGPLPDEGEDPVAVVEQMARDFDPGLVATAGPRYFGFVIGGQLPASAGADWLTGAWAQAANLHPLSPAAAAAELLAGPWMLDLLGLPADASFGFPTGAALGSTVGLAVGRHTVLQRVGWDVEANGLYGAPEIRVIVGDEVHSTLLAALQYLGLGRERVTRIPTDGQGRMRAELLPAALDLTEPTIVCIQAGNVNTGAFDPADAVADALANHPNAWLHVDGAFGLWAAASPELRYLVAGVERADSWATDAHKWLNSGYDCGFVAVRGREAHRAAMSATAAYLMQDAAHRDNWEYVLDSSRRARGFVVYAALRSLGRNGVREMVERCCSLARRLADRLRAIDGIEILNDVVLNQVLVRFTPPGGGDADAFTREVMTRVQDEGEAWMGGTTWHGLGAMRISVSNWSTSEADIDRTAEAILRATRG